LAKVTGAVAHAVYVVRRRELRTAENERRVAEVEKGLSRVETMILRESGATI